MAQPGSDENTVGPLFGAAEASVTPVSYSVHAEYHEHERRLAVHARLRVRVESEGTIRLWCYFDRLGEAPEAMDQRSARWVFPREVELAELDELEVTARGRRLPYTWIREDVGAPRGRDAAGGDLRIAGLGIGEHTIEVRYSLTLPRRFGRLGVVGDRVQLLGPWYPLVVRGDSFRFPVPHRIVFRSHGDTRFHFSGGNLPRAVDGGLAHFHEEVTTWVPVMGARRWHRYDRRVRGRRLRFYSPRPLYEAPAEDARGVRRLRDLAFSDVIGRVSAMYDEAIATARLTRVPTRDVDVLLVPTRTELVGHAGSSLLLSDRAYQVTPAPNIRAFHDRLVRDGMLQSFLTTTTDAAEPAEDAAAAGALRASILSELDALRRERRVQTPGELLSWAGFHPAVDQLLYAPQVAFVDDYFGSGNRWRDAPESARRPSASGDRIKAQARTAMGEARFREWARALLRFEPARESLARIAPESAPRWDDWVSQPGRATNYRIVAIAEEEEGGRHRTRVRIARDGDNEVAEPLEVEMEDAEGDRHTLVWDEAGREGEVTFDTEHAMRHVVLDPRRLLPQDADVADGHPLHDDRSHPAWRPPVFQNFNLAYAPTENRVTGLIEFVLRRRYDIDQSFSFLLATSARQTGGRVRYSRGFGRKRDTNGRVWRLSGAFSFNRLHAGFDSETNAEGGYAIGLGATALYNDQRYYLDPRSGGFFFTQVGGTMVVGDDGNLSFAFIPRARGNYTLQLGLRNALVFVGDVTAALGEALPSQLPSLGGRFSLRAYQTNEGLGRLRGFAVIEHRFTPTLFADLHWNLLQLVWVRQIQLAAFAGAGVSFDDEFAPTPGVEVGAGIRVHYEYFGIQPGVLVLDLAVPLLRSETQRRGRSPVSFIVAFEQYY